ncbi:MAG: tetratricopeptide repeat protein [Prevotella sp.]|nr:tetratricopeptide repeat protein [Prevotella sp.]
MSFLLIVVVSLVALGAIAAIYSIGGTDEPIVQKEGDCGSCSSRADCKLADLKEDIRRKKEGQCHEHVGTSRQASVLLLFLSTLLLFTGCSTKKNTPQTRWWHSFHARYNTYFNGSQAFIEGSLEKEQGNKDNYTELIPLYTVGNKQSRELGKANFDRAIEKSEKAIKQHTIKVKPEWNKSRRKTAKDLEWLNRREYNPFLWHAWLLLGKSQFQQGQFEEAAATFSYMSRLYQTQPAINGIARAWLAKSYTELDWLYDAEDVMTKQRRDTMHFRAVKDWDYTYADYYIHSGRYEEALPYLRKVIRHETRRKQKAREWFLYGQLQSLLGRKAEAYDAFKHTIRLNPPYELEFNARIAQTEVMARGEKNARQMVKRLKRMAASDNNKDYQDQVYYAIGNIWLAERDTTKAIEAYEEGNKKATRSGIEKGVLLLSLGNLYWEREKFSDAQRCYGEAIGLLDKDRKDYQQLSDRSKILDELVPHTSSVELQDSLQRLAKMPEEERLKVIDRIIDELKKKEKEEQRAREEAEAEQVLQQQSAVGNQQQTTAPTVPTTPATGGAWYFYNPQAVSQGKRTFEQQWGKRDNVDDWQRVNRTVVNMNPENPENADNPDNPDTPDSLELGTVVGDSVAVTTPDAEADSTALDPHKREFYLAQIPFTEDQVAASNELIKDGLFHAGILFKDKLDNLRLSEQWLRRLTTFPDYEKNDEAWYHLFLLYSRLGRTEEADHCLSMLKGDFPESQWTTLLSDPHFAENQRFGVHIEDSLYAATYDAFKADRHQEVKSNTLLSEQRFPLGQHRPKFLFIEGLSLLNDGDAKGCTERMKQVVDDYPQSEVSEMAGMILRGVQQGRTLYGGKFDMDDVWSRRSTELTADSTQADTLVFERDTKYVFLLAYQPDSVNQNQLLYEMAKYNFSNYLVRNFDIVTDQDPNGLSRMLISGFLSYDEARQYARQLHDSQAVSSYLQHCRSLIISEQNLRLLGTTYSYRDYEVFFEQQLAPVEISTQPLLDEPESITTEEDPEEEVPSEEAPQAPANTDDDLFNDLPQPQNSGNIEFDDDFWR